MRLFQRLKEQLYSILDLLLNASWLLSTEIIAKVSRIFTIVVLAAQLSPISYGTAMLALAFHDVFGLILRAGVGSQIINCKPDDLEPYAKNGIVIQGVICLTIASVQFISADFLASLYDNSPIATLLQLMAVIYLLYPWVSIKIFLLQRENKMRWFSIRNGTCIIIENITIAVAALLGAGILSVAIGKLAFSLFWLVLFSFAPVKSFGTAFDSATTKSMLKTSGKLFNTEFLRGVRTHADTFIAGKLLTPELFGFYTFAKNAGVGLSQSLSQVYISALYPYLCKLHRNNELALQQKKIFFVSVLISMMFVIQALLVPVYVPLIFDNKWFSTIPLITVLCLAAVPNLIIDTICCIQRVKEQYHSETFSRFICLIIMLFTVFLYNPSEPMEFALVIIGSSILGFFAVHFSYLISLFINNFVNRFIKLSNRRKPHEQ